MIYVWLAIGVGYLLLGAGCSYEKARADRAVNEHAAYVAEQKKIVADTTVRWAQAVQQADAGAQARLAAEKERSDEYQRQLAAVKSRLVTVSDSFSLILQHAGSGTPAADAGTTASGEGSAPTVPAGAQTAAYDERELAAFIIDARRAYDSAYDAWKAAVGQYEAVRAGVK